MRKAAEQAFASCPCWGATFLNVGTEGIRASHADLRSLSVRDAGSHMDRCSASGKAETLTIETVTELSRWTMRWAALRSHSLAKDARIGAATLRVLALPRRAAGKACRQRCQRNCATFACQSGTASAHYWTIDVRITLTRGGITGQTPVLWVSYEVRSLDWMGEQ